MDVPELLRFMRARAGVEQRVLAERAGTSRSAVSAYESGAKLPTVRTLERLAAACGLEVVATLRPLHADLDAQLAAAEAAGPPDLERPLRLADQLDDLGVQWAFDGATALALGGLHLPLDETHICVRFDERGRLWAYRAGLRGVDARGYPWVPGWLDVGREEGDAALAQGTFTVATWTRVRLVEELPVTVSVDVEGRTVPVLPAHEVERVHPDLARLLARMRERG